MKNSKLVRRKNNTFNYNFILKFAIKKIKLFLKLRIFV